MDAFGDGIGFILEFGCFGFQSSHVLTSDVVKNLLIQSQDSLVGFQCGDELCETFIDFLRTYVEVLVFIVTKVLSVTSTITFAERTSQNVSADWTH